jgi:hypothetical protein
MAIVKEVARHLLPGEVSLPDVDWRFIKDDDLRRMIVRDYAELTQLVQIDAPKNTLIAAGSLIETILLSVVAQDEDKARQKYQELYKASQPIDRWTLEQLIGVSAGLGILEHDLQQHANTIRDYRNLVHPTAERRRRSQIDDDMKTIALLMLRRILKSLEQTHE